MSVNTLAILVAAGRGARLGSGRPKAFVELQGESLLLRAARAFEQAPSVDGLVAVVPCEELERAQEMLEPLGKLWGVTSGGARRQDSVLEGMKLAPDDFDGVVLVHDAARPFVDVALIEAVVAAARESGAVLPVIPIAETVKRVRAGRVADTLDRAELSAAQTPQGFRFRLLARAYDEAVRQGWTLTDESMAVERLGEPVRTLAGSERNRKITTADDLAWAESLVQAEKSLGEHA